MEKTFLSMAHAFKGITTFVFALVLLFCVSDLKAQVVAPSNPSSGLITKDVITDMGGNLYQKNQAVGIISQAISSLKASSASGAQEARNGVKMAFMSEMMLQFKRSSDSNILNVLNRGFYVASETASRYSTNVDTEQIYLEVYDLLSY